MGSLDVRPDSASQRFLHFARSSDRAVLDELIAEHLDRAYSQARHLLGQSGDAEDVVQDAFLQLVRTAGRYDGSISFAAWLSRLVHHSSINALRSKRRRKRREREAGAGHQSEDDVNDSADETAGAVRDAVRDLPERYRATIDLHYLAGLSQRETAEALGMKEGAVAVRLHRARECLRSLLVRRGLSVTGAAIVLALTSIEVHAAPLSLQHSLQHLFAASSRSGILVAGAKGKLFFGLSAMQTWMALATCIAVLLGVFISLSPRDRTAAPLGATDRPEPEAPTPPTVEPFALHWDFKDGPIEGLPVIGEWEWVPAQGGYKAGMATLSIFGDPDRRVIVRMPGEVPDRPLVVTLLFHGEEGDKSIFFGWAQLDARPQGSTESGHWHAKVQPATIVGGTKRLTGYVTRTSTVVIIERQLAVVALYPEDRPTDTLAFSLPEGLVLESVDVHEAAPGEIPEQYREPAALTTDMVPTQKSTIVIAPIY